ncbi:hypothetical protein Salat_2093100 [Sesamum alatum]|uniref:DUF4283 domain-containing protein n=1 Tax=Sesamum alatum TaxID=300844 RepID=A0AAE1Y1B0_9LAMI|nr:hypothetical protein Salat_2093100 [Sesamum alatum]
MLNLDKVKVIRAASEGTHPKIELDQDYVQSIRRVWQETVVLKLVGKSFSYNILSSKVNAMWDLNGDNNLIALGHNSFILKLSDQDKVEYNLTKGPWMIYNHFLVVRKWLSNFKHQLTKSIQQSPRSTFRSRSKAMSKLMDTSTPWCTKCGRVGYRNFECTYKRNDTTNHAGASNRSDEKTSPSVGDDKVVREAKYGEWLQRQMCTSINNQFSLLAYWSPGKFQPPGGKGIQELRIENLTEFIGIGQTTYSGGDALAVNPDGDAKL